jgi:hypothetical protein
MTPALAIVDEVDEVDSSPPCARYLIPHGITSAKT